MAQMKSKQFQMNIQLLEHTTVQHPIPSFDQSQQIYHQVWIFIKSSPIFNQIDAYAINFKVGIQH